MVEEKKGMSGKEEDREQRRKGREKQGEESLVNF
jgi:hypothetical protein